jgi:hypothetical protein
MSLVSDALRKARQYATARDIQRHGAAAGALSPPPRRSRLGLGLVLGAFIALAAAAAGAVFVLWALRDVAAGRDDAATVRGPHRRRCRPHRVRRGRNRLATAAPQLAERARRRAKPWRKRYPGRGCAHRRAAAHRACRAVACRLPARRRNARHPARRSRVRDAQPRLPGLQASGGFGRANGQDVAPG